MRDRGVLRVAEVLHDKGEVRRLLGERDRGSEGTYGEDVHGGLHDDIKTLAVCRVAFGRCRSFRNDHGPGPMKFDTISPTSSSGLTSELEQR